MAGTQLVPPEKFPQPRRIATAPAFAPPAPRQDFGALWTAKTHDQLLTAPVIAGDLLIAGTYNNSVAAFARQGGAATWSLPQDAYIFALALSEDGTLYACEGLHQTTAAALSAIEPRTGRIRWRRQFLGHLEEPPALDPHGPMLWQGAGPGGLWALNARNGGVYWHRALGHIDAQPLLEKGVIYAPFQPDEKKEETAFYALDARSGETLWQVTMPGQPWGGPVLDKTRRVIFTTTGKGQIGVARPDDKGWAEAVTTDGRLLWQTALADMPLQPGAYVADQDLIVYTLKNGGIVALRAADGSRAWQAQAGSSFQSPAALITGSGRPMIAAVSYDGIFTLRDAATGGEIFRAPAGLHSNAAPVADGDIVYVTGAYEITAFAGLHTLAHPGAEEK
jgi:outer membrane protein assembly factor BamB